MAIQKPLQLAEQMVRYATLHMGTSCTEELKKPIANTHPSMLRSYTVNLERSREINLP
ncbi:MAG: hypothetical protein ICV55_11900 [Coleofasciculus sp. C3-bin4]|nr:hypothetical protein [Coleofasciculus sp. C3-bin4]